MRQERESGLEKQPIRLNTPGRNRQFALPMNPFLARTPPCSGGTSGSNPLPSSGESFANSI
jgi:hypothetical protein